MAEEMRLPTLLDNVSGNTVLAALGRLLPRAAAWDVASGSFEVGQLLALGAAWQAVPKVRVLLGDETARRRPRELQDDLRRRSDDSIEAQKERDDAAARSGLPPGIPPAPRPSHPPAGAALGPQPRESGGRRSSASGCRPTCGRYRRRRGRGRCWCAGWRCADTAGGRGGAADLSARRGSPWR